MKILEITRSFYPSIGGMEKFVSDRLKIYEKLGYNYQVITTTHSEKKIIDKRLKEITYLKNYTPYGIVPSLTKAMEEQYDTLSLNQLSYYYSVQAVNSAWEKGKKIILTPHFHFHTNKFKIIKTFHNNFFVPEILKKVNRIICFTNYEAAYWKEKFPFTENKISIIPHYFLEPERKLGSAEKKYEKFFLFLGRGEKNKRIDLLIKAFSNTKTGFHLLLTLEEDELCNDLSNIIKTDNRIHLLGRVSENEKQNLLATCSALILPTDFEAFGIVNFEASFCKKPLLLTGLPVFKNILHDDGVIYFNNNLKSVKSALEQFTKLNEDEKNKMGNINFENLKKYSFEKISQKYLQMFKELNL